MYEYEYDYMIKKHDGKWVYGDLGDHPDVSCIYGDVAYAHKWVIGWNSCA